jgi:hypothetical protein
MELQFLILVFQVVTGFLVLYGAMRIKSELKLDRDKLHREFEDRWNDLKRQDKFRLAALDKRMEAHQKAFALARKMFSNVHSSSDKKMAVTKECQQFIDTYVLYLTEDARESFWQALHNFDVYEVFLSVWRDEPKDEENNKTLDEAFNTIRDLPAKLVSIVDHESLGRVYSLKSDSLTPIPPKQKKRPKQ